MASTSPTYEQGRQVIEITAINLGDKTVYDPFDFFSEAARVWDEMRLQMSQSLGVPQSVLEAEE